MTSQTRLKRKEVDDVLGGEEMWKDADQAESKLMFRDIIERDQEMTLSQNSAINVIQIVHISGSCKFIQQTIQ